MMLCCSVDARLLRLFSFRLTGRPLSIRKSNANMAGPVALIVQLPVQQQLATGRLRGIVTVANAEAVKGFDGLPRDCPNEDCNSQQINALLQKLEL
jgi:hypothetical protein